MRRHAGIIGCWLLALTATCGFAAAPAAKREVIAAAKIERWDPALDAIVPRDAQIEKLAEGFGWAEGPVWVASGSYLLFTDVPGNKMWKWSEKAGLELFLDPSGGVNPDPSIWREAGANGLYPDAAGSILVADTGNRMIARLNLATKQKTPVATQFDGKKLSTPNDVVRTRAGVVFFTDPPYGFRKGDAAEQKEQSFNGVYRVATDGKVTVIEKELTRPNGVALSPDERTLYVTQSEAKRGIVMAYSLDASANVTGSRLFHDATDLIAAGGSGLPDGLTVAADGTLFIGGPGGVLVLSKDGKRLGRISTGMTTANCKFGDDGRTLYLTSSNMLARIRLNISGANFR